MFAVIKTGGKQYKVAEGEKLKIEKIEKNPGDVFNFEEVLAVIKGADIQIGKPLLSSAKVEAKVLENGRADKVIVFKYHSKTRQRKKKGHRQTFSQIQITKITA
ncbi:MAG: 50S ribosomal protein L21 [Candidatus Pacebacteria bacterium]|nr:50S ribosomal protein L21 [Candidatus Paceibacterota bacterium]